MKLSYLKVLSAVCALVLLIAVPVFSEDASSTKTPAPAKEAPAATPVATPAASPVAVPVTAPVPEAMPQAKETAIYGEVQTIDAAANILAVQYYDYDSDSEKTSDISINVDTKLENVSTLGDVKKGDWVDVSYTVIDAKNVAKSIVVEKEDTTAAEGTSSAVATDTETEQ